MKVFKDTVLTSELKIKDSKTLRRLEVGEVVEIITAPTDEGTVKVQRVRCRTMKDQLVGYLTMTGNQGTTFLEEGGNTFKVVSETLLTEAFALDAPPREETKKHMTQSRKLKVGEIVEVREWPKAEEKSGLMRMKCRARSDGIT